MKKNNKVKNPKFFCEFELLADNTYKVILAKKLTRLNQFRSTWKRIDGREFSRKINKAELVIK